MSDDDYLWEKKGAPDADVERLERVLRPLGREDGAPIAAPARAPASRMRLLIGGALAAAVAAGIVVAMLPTRLSPRIAGSMISRRDPSASVTRIL